MPQLCFRVECCAAVELRQREYGMHDVLWYDMCWEEKCVVMDLGDIRFMNVGLLCKMVRDLGNMSKTFSFRVLSSEGKIWVGCRIILLKPVGYCLRTFSGFFSKLKMEI